MHVSKVQLSASFHVTYDEVARCGRPKCMTEIRKTNVGTEYQHWFKLGKVKIRTKLLLLSKVQDMVSASYL
jgi:hypothetical protein